MKIPGCELCDSEGGETIFRHEKWRVVAVTGAEAQAYPGFCRVVWNAHIREMTDLTPPDRQQFMAAVFAVEAALRASIAPFKLNLASLGNLTPHLHWHVIPRFADDPAFPKPIWAHTLPAHCAGQLDTLATQSNRRSASDATWQTAVRHALESV
jgi:diadenosine tetraphosphate (Ap4A) HIT family hydrolase